MFLAAVFACPGYHDVFQFALKTVLSTQRSFNAGEQVILAVYRRSAIPADDMVVMTFFCMVKYHLAVHLTLEHTIQRFQQFQRAVDGGLVDAGHPGLHDINNFLGCKMITCLMDDIQDQLALRRQLESMLF